MLYVKSIKNFEVRRGKSFIILPCAKKNTQQIYYFAVCKKKQTPCAKIRRTAKHDFVVYPTFAVRFLGDTLQKSYLPCAKKIAHGKLWAHGKYAVSRSGATR